MVKCVDSFCFIGDLRRGVTSTFLVQIVASVLNILMVLCGTGEKMGIFGKFPTITFAVIITLTSVISLFGLTRENRFYFLPWVVTVLIIIIGNIVLSFAIFYYPESFQTSIYDVPMILITTAIFMYLFVCVISLYSKMSDTEYKPPYGDEEEEHEVI